MRTSLVLMVALTAGCSARPAPLMTIPAGHPGHADSGNVPYQPPPDPLKGEVSPAPAPAVPGGHENHGKGEPQKPAYPLDVCVVSGEKLGSMGKPVILDHEGREVRLCCPNCIEDFKKDPGPYLRKLDEAAKKQSGEKKSEEHPHDQHGGHP
jgi:hypothetical protein